MTNSGKRPKIYGLTGGIASGKSMAARFFAELGVVVIDADQIARELRAPGGKAHAAIVKRFGSADAAELRKLVFQNEKARRDLEAILHPLIQSEADQRFERAFQENPDARYGIYEATLLIETSRAKDFAGLILVVSPLPERVLRLMARDKISEHEARQIIDSQMSDSEKEKHATFLLRNAGGSDHLRNEVLRLNETLVSSS